MEQARQQRIRAAWVVVAATVLTLALTLLLIGVFFRSILVPLRRLVAEARGADIDSKPAIPAGGEDELLLVGQYFRAMMSDAADSRATERSRQAQLQHAEKLASVGRLAASVAHEIRNPLNAIRLWLHSIQRATADRTDLGGDFQSIIDEIGRLERIVRTFLEFSRPPLLRPSVQSLEPILQKVAKLLEPKAMERGNQLALDSAPALPPVSVDADPLEQVLLNLLNNALEASCDGAPVRLATTQEPGSDGRAVVAVRVTNRGTPIPPDVAERIFEPFFSTKRAGTGLGLCIAAQIVAGHGGRLRLESSTDEGTTFVIFLPAAPTKP